MGEAHCLHEQFLKTLLHSSFNLDYLWDNRLKDLSFSLGQQQTNCSATSSISYRSDLIQRAIGYQT